MVKAMAIHVIHIAPARRAGKSDALIGGRQIVAMSRTPFCDGARALLADGTALPGDALIMRRASSEHDALKATVGVAARLTVAESATPRFAKWVAPEARGYKAAPDVMERAPMREPEAEAGL